MTLMARARLGVAIVLLVAAGGVCPATPMPAAGVGHNLALHRDGTVRSWGSDSLGELGLGTITYSNDPAPVPGLPPMQALFTGGSHALAIATDGSLWGWGLFEHWDAPRRVPGLEGVTAAAAGATHNVAITSGGQVWTWGSNSFGQLGNGTNQTRSAPERIGLTGAIAATAGDQFTLVLMGDGSVRSFGSNDYGQLGDGTTTARNTPVTVQGLANVIAISAGHFHAVALKADGSVWTWGSNRFGELGDGTLTNRSVPIQVQGVTAVKVSAGSTSDSYALAADGKVWFWGPATPQVVSGYPAVASIDAGHGLLVAVLSDGTVWREAIIGSPLRFPRVIPGLTGVVAASAGGNFALALRGDGTVLAWGYNTYGELGTGRVFHKPVPVSVPGLASVKQVSAGGHSLALLDDGAVTYWGTSFLDTGTLLTSPTPVPGLSGVTQVSAGGIHAAALKSDGSVWTFGGSNSFGELGRGALDTADPMPAMVPGLTGVTRVSAGSRYVVALRSDGTVWAWGRNRAGILGVAPTHTCQPQDLVNQVACTPAPAQVQGIDNVVDVSGGGDHIIALRADGTVWAWGDNYNGALGDGTEGGLRTAPAPVPGLTGVIAIAAGAVSWSAVLKSDGTVWAWGDNRAGQLGDRERFRTTPARVQGVDAIVAISAGGEHALAMRSDGVLFSWGSNLRGQLGDGTFVDRSRPTAVLRVDAAGTLDGGDWYLDLDPSAADTTIPVAATPGMIAVAQRSGSDTLVSLDATAKFKGADIGKSVNLYVLAQVPPAFFERVKLAPGAKSAAELRAKNGNALVLAQLTPQGWTNAVGQLIAYSQGVGNAAGAAASILDGLDATAIPGARFCIGYGETAEAMLSSLVLRDVLEIAGTSGTASGVPCVLAGVYLSGPAASRLAAPVTFTASVVGLSPTGSVQFFDGAASMSGGVALASANEAVARASVTTSGLAAGIHAIAASYSGDAQNASVPAANSTPLRHEVSAPSGGTRVDLTGPVSSQLGESVAFSAIVTGASPTGTVQFKDGAANLGAAVPVVGAVAALTLTNLATGSHTITAVYSGDGNNGGSTSNALAHAVYASIATKVALASSANPAAQGAAVTLTATVTGASPTGSVAFRDGAAVVATVALANGTASTTLAGLGAGLHVMVADYLGDGSNAAASSPVLFQQVTAAGASIGAFAPRADVVVSTLVVSNPALVTGVGSGQAISVIRGEYSIGCTGTFTSAAGIVTEGQRVCVRQATSADFATTVRTTLVVGTATADFTTTTMTYAFRAGITALVSHYYSAVLRRLAEPSGQAFWEGEGLRMHMLGANVAEGFYAMAMAFFASAEYVARDRDANGYVTDLYITFFDRVPEAAGLTFWSGQLNAGLPREVLLAQFMFSAEFDAFLAARFGSRTARAEVDMVGDFYRGLLARLPDSSGFDFWVRRFRTAQCAGAASVVAEVEAISSAFATGAEYAARARDHAPYAGDLYNAFLRRGGDLGGVQFWINQVATGARTREQVRREFIASPEFNARVNAVLAQGCLP